MILLVLLGIRSTVLPKAEFVSSGEQAVEVGAEIGVLGGMEAPEGMPPEGMEAPEGMPPEGMEVPEGMPPEGTPPEEAPEEIGDVFVAQSEIVDPKKEASEEEEALATGEVEEEEEEGVLVDGSGVTPATLSDILLAPILGFEDAVDVCIFLLVLGGFLAVMAKTKALETGIKLLVKKLRGKEYLLILLLMFIFSILGTTYGFLEESVGFYILIAATMFAAGMDPLVGVATILLGAGAGVLGSTINPFATGVALSAMKDAGIAYDQGLVLLIGVVLWLTTLAISAFFVVRYAKKVQRDKGSTFLTLREQALAEKKYGNFLEKDSEITLTVRQKITLGLFALSFLVMIVGFVPWGDFGITFFDSWTGWLTGSALGSWWFYEAAVWFLIMAIVISIVNRQGEHGFIDAFVDGADDMVGVILIIAVARGASVLMANTHLDNYIIYNATQWLANLPEMLFVPLNYILHVVMSFIVPSSSGLATLSTPIVAPLAANLGYSTEVAAMTIVAANGFVNLFTPTCGAIMGGFALAKIEYPTWLRWVFKVLVAIFIVNIAVLCLFSL